MPSSLIQENNWEPILEEAAQEDSRFRGGPSCQCQRSSLFLTHIGPSFKAEGNRAGLYVSNYYKEHQNETINVLELTDWMLPGRICAQKGSRNHQA